jgi:methylenetetrahydromethanopterin dehydrogenase
MLSVIKFGVIKVGCMGSLPLLEFLIDERADREDVDVIVCGSGAKLGLKQSETVTKMMITQNPQFVILIGPAQQAPGPKLARKILVEAGIPTLVISDGPARKLIKDFETSGIGYFIIDADAMIGARREYLDPIEMILFNSDILKVLAITGVLQLITDEIDHLIQAVKENIPLKLPQILVTKEQAIEVSGLSNPYAKAKAMAAYEIAKRAAAINSQGCFRVTEWEHYVALVASGHELVRDAARMADEAREIDKAGDQVKRSPHYPNGIVGKKVRLIEKPSKVKQET